MAQVLIRGLSADVVDRLKARAQSHGRSVESEVRTILENASGFSVAQARRSFQVAEPLCGAAVS